MPAKAPAAQRTATLALLLATLFWGCGFTWAKAAGAAVNHLALLPPGAPLGPIWLRHKEQVVRQVAAAAYGRSPLGKASLALVLPILEGVKPILELKVIARTLLA